MVQPVSVPTPAPSAFYDSLTGLAEDGGGWLPDNLDPFPAAAADVTAVNPSGTPQAFALSLADLMRLSTPDGTFPDMRSRAGARHSWWWLRTPSTTSLSNAWSILNQGRLASRRQSHITLSDGGVRPVIIVHQ